MRLKIEKSTDRMTRRSGLVLTSEFGKQIDIARIIDEEFPRPGSNRGKPASTYVNALVWMFHDGAMHLEDIRHFEHDTAIQELLEVKGFPTPDALGDWLRRHGGPVGEAQIWSVSRRVFAQFPWLHGNVPTTLKEGMTLDIDATVIEAEKGDATMSYKGVRGYQPLLAILSEVGLVLGSEFRTGSVSPQAGLREMVDACRQRSPWPIACVRSDAAAYNRSVIEYCQNHDLFFSVSAAQTTAVLEALEKIPEKSWRRGVARDGIREPWEVAETVHGFSSERSRFRLIAKRTPLNEQGDLFRRYKYWVVATNLPTERYDALAVIQYHQGRGEMERIIGELKSVWNLDHLPCGQFSANALYFTVGVLAYNLMQMLRVMTMPRDTWKKSMRSIRYQLLHLAGRLLSHARYMLLRLVAPDETITAFQRIYARVRYAPA